MSSKQTPTGLGTNPRYAIGIDLGTTNCALAYVALADAQGRATLLQIPQWDQPGAVVASPTLPAYYYLPPKSDWKRGQFALPQHGAEAAPDYVVGRLARWQTSLTPGRVIHQAKSWLCHDGVSREERILPWHVGDLIGDERRSPVEVSAAYLRHLREAWDATIARDDPTASFTAQDVVITVPASFDEAAQRLTLEAAALAGYAIERVRLLEEPQAAFYHWLASGQAHKVQGTVLICDVGGGTTDFSLFSVEPSVEGQPLITRVAVSDHLLLGGDNIDLALAQAMERKLLPAGDRLSSREWAQLVFASRLLKEQALSGASDFDAAADLNQSLSVSIAGEGASLMASAKTVSMTRGEVLELVLGGFFPQVTADAKVQKPRLGLSTLGLRYAHDSAVSRHLAAFVGQRPIDAVLFNGGTLKPVALRSHLLAQLKTWQNEREPEVLESPDMDLAVALGAARYGFLQHAPEHLIRGGYARSVYIEVETSGGSTVDAQLICVVPQGYDGTSVIQLDQLSLKARADRPVRFQLYTATDRGGDKIGAILPRSTANLHRLPPLDTRISMGGKSAGQLIDVQLEVNVAETGLLALKLISKEPRQTWQLDFNLRATASVGAEFIGETQAEPKIDAALILPATEKIDALFGKKKPVNAPPSPRGLIKDLETVLRAPRDQWSSEMLRGLWPNLADGMTRRSRSAEHEVQWLNLTGYCLRPGYGHPLDEWRVQDLWRCFEQGLCFPKERQVEEQWWIMWRRVAGGLDRKQQESLWDRIFPALRRGDASPELYLLAGSLERVDMAQKVRLGQQLVQQIADGRKQHVNQKMWALARLASRVPLYGGAHTIIRPETVVAWFEQLNALRPTDAAYAKLPLFLSQAGRLINDREYDLPADARAEFLKKLAEVKATPEQRQVVQEYVPVDTSARSQLFGESLPVGLVLT